MVVCAIRLVITVRAATQGATLRAIQGVMIARVMTEVVKSVMVAKVVIFNAILYATQCVSQMIPGVIQDVTMSVRVAMPHVILCAILRVSNVTVAVILCVILYVRNAMEIVRTVRADRRAA
jgi:hypothetical protein